MTQDVKGKGKAGDVVKVNDGYARNMLIPKGLAKEATQGNVRSLEKQKALAEEKREEQKAAAIKQAEELEKITVTIQSKGGENGKLFGSITSKDIAEALEKQENVKVDKKKISNDVTLTFTNSLSDDVRANELFSDIVRYIKRDE